MAYETRLIKFIEVNTRNKEGQNFWLICLLVLKLSVFCLHMTRRDVFRSPYVVRPVKVKKVFLLISSLISIPVTAASLGRILPFNLPDVGEAIQTVEIKEW